MAQSAFDGIVTASVNTISGVADLEGIVLTYVGATTIVAVDEDDFGGIYLQDELGSEIYALWHPSLGGNYTINGNTVTLTGWSTTDDYCTPFPTESATLYLSDYATFIADGYDDTFDDIELAYGATYECPTAAVLSIAQAIAAYDNACIAENDSISVYGYITKMEFKPSNFTRYGSVNIYVTDTEGNVFEFYNCYSLGADTFKTCAPEPDSWTSTTWHQVAYMYDRHGNQINVGDSVVARGKFKKYNTTYELNTGCYLTYAPERHLQPQHYLIGGGELMGNWTLSDALPFDLFDDNIVVELPAGNYEFKVLPTNTGWDGELNATKVDHDCSSANVRGTNNIHVALAEPGTLAISLTEDGNLCIIGAFAERDFVNEWTIVGDPRLLGSNWDLNDANNLMTVVSADSITITKYDLALTAGNYQWKVVGDHSWNTQFPASGDFILTIEADGVYDVVFGLNIVTGVATTYLSESHATSLDATAGSATNAVKFIENGQLIIVKDGVRYNAQGARL